MDIRPGEIFPDEIDATLIEDAPYTPSALEQYLEICFVDEHAGPMKRYYPAPKTDQTEEM